MNLGYSILHSNLQCDPSTPTCTRISSCMATSTEVQSTSTGQQEEEEEEEIHTLRDYFKDSIRILSSIGQFSYILKIRADQFDVSLTLQLDKSYPKKAPEIIITAPRLTPDQILLVQQLLQSYSQTLLNQPMILPIYHRLLKWFDENKIQALTININNNNNNNNNNSSVSPSIPRSPTNVKFISPFISLNNQNKLIQSDEHDSTRQCPMKTAEDVIARMAWDQRLDKSVIRIGYIDHGHSLQERAYHDLDLKTDLPANNDQPTNILTLPKHCIQYIKYANEIIWDRDSRIDLIFGSTGSSQTIDDLIKRHEKLVETKISEDERKEKDLPHTLPIKRYLTVADGLYEPNYLLSFPITDASLISYYTSYREHLLSSYPSLFSSSHFLSIDPQHLHLTLLTLRLESPLQIEQCILALKRIQEEIHYHCCYPERICLAFDGVDTFHNKILFVKCEPNVRLNNLRTLMVERLCEQQQKQKMNEIFFAGNYQEFIPHITLFKSKRKFSPSIYPSHQTISFGKQYLDALHLSSINTNENEQQTNHCIFKLDLS